MLSPVMNRMMSPKICDHMVKAHAVVSGFSLLINYGFKDCYRIISEVFIWTVKGCCFFKIILEYR